MHLESQIRTMLQEMPLQYGNRTQALLGLFGMPDNSLTWQGGELVPASRHTPATKDPGDLLANIDPHATYDLGPSAQSLHVYGQFTQAMNRARRARSVRGDLDRLVHYAPVPRIVPPDFADGRIREVPGDVRDDWLLGAMEFLLLVLRMDPSFTTKTQKNSDQIQTAGELRQALLRRFAHRVAFVSTPAPAVMTASSDEMAESAGA